MSSYRIIVEEGGQPVAQGTGWLVEGTIIVVTALHVVGREKSNENMMLAWIWRHEDNEDVGEEDIGYFLEGNGGERVRLRPWRFDAVADVALLQLEHRVDGLVGLAVSDAPPARRREWRGKGYWQESPDSETFSLSLTGHIADVPGDASNSAVQLQVDQGTDRSWQGMSGSPICDEKSGEVIAVLTSEIRKASTLWAAHINAVKRLLGREVEREEATLRPERIPSIANLPPAFLEWFQRESEGALHNARQCLHEGRPEEARSICDQEIDKIESMGVDPRHDPELAPRWFDARLVRAACLLNLQAVEDAGEQARAIDREIQELDSSYFTHHPRPILLAQILAQSGDLDRASELVRELAEEDAQAVRQHIEILRGHVPADWDELITEPFVRLSACEVLLDRGEHDRAVGETLAILQRQDLRPSYQGKAIAVLLRAMRDHFYGLPSQAVGIDAQRKRRAVAELQKYLDPERPLLEGAVPEHILGPWIADFHYLSWDRMRVDQACARLRRSGLDDSPYRPVADEGERPPSVETDNAPVWLRLMNEAYRLQEDGNTDQALDVISRALAEYPERPLLERAAAVFHVANGTPEKAAEHARRAFFAFPGHGQAILWAEMLHAADDPHTVWTRLHDELHGSPNLSARRMLAWAAYCEAPAQALDYWQEVIEVMEGDREAPLDRMHLARAMALTGDLAGAADMAWQACEPMLDGERDEAGADETCVAICARLQWGHDFPEREERLHRLALALWQIGEKRSSRTAQLEYLELWQRLGRPKELPTPDVPRLLEERVLVNVPRDEFQQVVTDRRAHLMSLYVHGSLTLEDLAHQLATEDTELFEHVLRRDFALRTPLPRFAEPDDFSGRDILLGSFELAILDHLQLLAVLPDALGPEGKLLLFRDVHRRILEAPAMLASRESPQQIGRMRALAELIGRSALASGQAQKGSDLEWATEHGTILVSATRETSDEAVSLHDAALWLHDQGHLNKSHVAELLRERNWQPIALDAAIRERLEQATSAPWMFDETALHALVRAGLVRDVFRCLEGRIAVTRSARMWLDQTIENMELISRARARAQRIQRFLVERERKGRLRVIERPDVALSPAKDKPDAQMRREWFQRALSWRNALLEYPQAWLVSADSLCAEGVNRTAPAELYDALSIRTDGDFLRLSEQLHQVDERVASIVPLCRVLAHESRRDEMVEKLALLGFADAYTAADLIGHAEQYGGLDGVRPGRILKRIEGRQRRGLIVDGLWYRVHIGTLYARTIFAAWCRDEPSGLCKNITNTLLGRMLELDGTGPYSILRGFFGCLCALAVDYPQHSLIQGADGSYHLSHEESQAGAMWQAIDQWSSVQPDGVRGRLCTVLDQQAGLLLRQIDQLHDHDPPQLRMRVAPLLLAGTVLRDSTTTLEPGSLMDTLSILSALWPSESRPLTPPISLDDGRSVSVEDWLIHGGTLIGNENSDIKSDGVAFWVPFPGSSWRLPCAPAALFLRSPHNQRSHLAPRFVQAFGPDDGRIVGALHKLAENPDDSEALRDYAHSSVLPPWQSFRLHPESIVEWGSPMCVGLFPNKLGELREVLSEPGPLPHGKEMHEVMVERVTDGPWRDREDVVMLLERSSELIVDPWLPFMWREHTAAIDFDASLQVLEQAHDHPSARLAFHLLVCIFVAGEQTKDSEARRKVAMLIGRVAADMATKPPADTLAACESHLMHHAMWAVGALINLGEAPDSRLTVPDWLWLTESLYLWMVRQLEALPLQRREAHLRILRALSPERPGVSWRASRTFLDPTRFGQEKLDIRLLLVLRTLAYLESERIQWLATNELRRVLEQLGRRELTPQEREVQALPASAMPRSWADLPRTVPEMAAHVLKKLGTPRSPRTGKARKKRRRKKRRRNRRQ